MSEKEEKSDQSYDEKMGRKMRDILMKKTFGLKLTPEEEEYLRKAKGEQYLNPFQLQYKGVGITTNPIETHPAHTNPPNYNSYD